MLFFFFFSSRRRHTRFDCDWSSDVCSSDLCVITRSLRNAVVTYLNVSLSFLTAQTQNHTRSEEHTSELQSQSNLVCRLLLEKKKISVCGGCIRLHDIVQAWIWTIYHRLSDI